MSLAKKDDELPARLVCKKTHRFDVYIGRGSKFGNPYDWRAGTKARWRAKNREDAVRKYKEWFVQQPDLLADLEELRGKTLGCYCRPGQTCHGEVLLELLVERSGKAPPEKSYDPRKLGARCDECPLKGKRVVPPSKASSGKTRLVLVGEGPGRMEELAGKPFIGPSGKRLDKTLALAGLDRDDAHVTNATLCRPDSDEEMHAAVGCCAPRLLRELKKLPQEAPVVALGGASSKVLLGTRGIIKARGFVWDVPVLDEKQLKATKRAVDKAREKGKPEQAVNARLKLLRQQIVGRKVFPTLHPAFVLRSEIWSAILTVDLHRVSRWLERGELRMEDEGLYVIVTSAMELEAQLKSLGKTITIDIETDGPDPLKAKLLCIGIGDGKKTIVARWKTLMAPVISRALMTRTMGGHNVVLYDNIVCRRYGISIDPTRVWDTLIAHHAFASHLPKSLAHVASVFCDSKPWKQLSRGDGSNSEKGLPHHLSDADLYKYNASDVMLTAKCWPRMQNDLADERHVYEQDMRVAYLCSKMVVKGFRFDTRRAIEIGNILRRRERDLMHEMRKLTGNPDFKPTRPSDIRQALFTDFGVKLIRPTASGLPSTARAILEQLRNGEDKAGRLSDMVLRCRTAAKTRSTFLAVPVGDDGRVHAGWRLGPVTGRLACRAPNLMNLPRMTRDKDTGLIDATDRVRECYVAGKGKVLVYFDLSQAEMRFAANVSGDPRFIESCRGDVHSNNAKILFPEAAAQGWLDGKEAKEGKGKEFRDITKNAGFAVTYIAEWETVYAFLTAHGFAVAPSDVKTMLSHLHDAYAGYFAFVDTNVGFVKRNGYLRTAALGRIRWFGQFPKPTEVANYPIQGGIADHMNERLLRLDDALAPVKGASIIAQIHDAAIIECWERDVEDVKGLVRQVYDPPVCLPNRDPFLIPIDMKTGVRWSEF